MEHQTSLNLKKPNFFIVGAPKCGTTALYHYLKTHPDIFLAPKEIHYFCKDFTNYNRFHNDNDYLVKNFAYVTTQKLIGDSSVWYLYSKVAAQKIKDFSPSAKIIIMLRNPVEMLYSLHSQLLFEGDESILSFEDALSAIKERKLGNNLPQRNKSANEALFYLEVPIFSEQVKRYFDIFGREKVLVIIYDEFCQSPENSYLRTLDFLGVAPPEQMPSFERINSNKKIRSKLFWRVRHFSPFWLRKIWRTFLPPLLRGNILRAISRINTYESPREPMKSETRTWLQKKFSPEINRLSALLGKDLSHWVKNTGKSNENDE
jgi:hypothetical protein